MALPGPTDVAWRVTIPPGPPVDLYGMEPTVSTVRIRVKNPHAAQSIFIGGRGVTPGDGYELGPGDAETFIIHSYLGQHLCAVVAGAPAVTVQCIRGLK